MDHGKYSGVVDIARNGVDEVIRLRADNERLKNELFKAKSKAGEWRMKAKTESMRADALHMELGHNAEITGSALLRSPG